MRPPGFSRQAGIPLHCDEDAIEPAAGHRLRAGEVLQQRLIGFASIRRQLLDGMQRLRWGLPRKHLLTATCSTVSLFH